MQHRAVSAGAVLAPISVTAAFCFAPQTQPEATVALVAVVVVVKAPLFLRQIMAAQVGLAVAAVAAA